MALFHDEVVILDGGLATELKARGCDISGALWSARVLRSSPETIEQLHYDYYAAGARIAITASYQASYEGFAAVGLDAGETTRLLRLSVELARNARQRYRTDHPADRRELFVAASVGPYGATLHDGSEYRGDYGLTVEELVQFHVRRFDVLATAGAEFLACETIPLLDEARAYLKLLKRHPGARAWLSFTTADGTRTSHGEPLADCARLVDRVTNVIAVGVNCVKPEFVSDAILALRSGTSKPIVVYPNSGERWEAADGSWHGSRDLKGIADLAPGWVGAGARLVGGCCRVGPGEIAALGRALARSP
jgi:homocysteine S-methyltransferase